MWSSGPHLLFTSENGQIYMGVTAALGVVLLACVIAAIQPLLGSQVLSAWWVPAWVVAGSISLVGLIMTARHMDGRPRFDPEQLRATIDLRQGQLILRGGTYISLHHVQWFQDANPLSSSGQILKAQAHGRTFPVYQGGSGLLDATRHMSRYGMRVERRGLWGAFS